MEASGQRHAPAAKPSGKWPRPPSDKKLGRPQSRCRRGNEEKYCLLLRRKALTLAVRMYVVWGAHGPCHNYKDSTLHNVAF
jgi:hypothetical protein